MYVDGMIGNTGLIEALGNLTAGLYNYIRAANTAPYKLKDTIPRAHDYIYPPQDKTILVNDALLTYMTQARGFKKELFKGG